MVYKQPEQQACTTSQTARNWVNKQPKWHESWQNNSNHRSINARSSHKQDLTNRSAVRFNTESNPVLALLKRVTCRRTDWPHIQIVFRSFFPRAFIGTHEGPLTPRCSTWAGPLFDHALRLIEPLFDFVYMHLAGFKSGQSTYNPVEWFTNRSEV